MATAARISAGGEGEVFESRGSRDLVCKIYAPHNRTREREQKLQAMVKNRISSDRHPFLTWPLNVLYGINDGKFAGYTMPRSAAEDTLTRCISPLHRRKATKPWAKTGDKGLYYIAFNLALAFETCHRNGICIGDVNETNIMVTPEGLPVIIDNDSFQIPNPVNANEPFLSPVVQPDFTPPERRSTKKKISAAQDNFGLAVIIYKLLHSGVHPFAGKDSPGVEHIPDISGRIKAHRFVHSSSVVNQWQADARQLNLWSELSYETQSLFTRALDYRNHGINRPTATEWKDAIDQDINERWPEKTRHSEKVVREEPACYHVNQRPKSENLLKTCQCSICSCQEAAIYAYCNDCALNHEKTVVRCQCTCLCENVHPSKYTNCYACSQGRHKSGSRPVSAVPDPNASHKNHPLDNNENPRKTCQCSKCQCQEIVTYDFCIQCGLDHEETLMRCQCPCECGVIHARKWSRCYNCHQGRHKSGSRPLASVPAPPSTYSYDPLDGLGDLPF